MTMTPVLETHIFRDEKGTVCVDSPRNKVKMLVPMIRNCGGIEETIAEYPHLTRAQLHAAMTYYYDHQEEIDRVIDGDEEYLREWLAHYQEPPVAKKVREAMRQAGKLP